MDFITGLLKTGEYNIILVVIDRLIKMAYFFFITFGSKNPGPENLRVKTLNMARLFCNRIIILYGIPSFIISDRDPRFTVSVFR